MQRDRAIAVIATVVALAAIICAALVYRKYRSLKQKNRVLASQIAEAIKYKNMYFESLTPDSSQGGAGGEAEADGIVSLFRHIEQVILEEQLYLNPSFDSQTAAERFGISSRRIGAAFSQGSEYKSLPRFVRECRLQHACRLLVSQPDMSIKAVGEASGFSNYTTFVTDFKAKYFMKPSDYRKSQ